MLIILCTALKRFQMCNILCKQNLCMSGPSISNALHLCHQIQCDCSFFYDWISLWNCRSWLKCCVCTRLQVHVGWMFNLFYWRLALARLVAPNGWIDNTMTTGAGGLMELVSQRSVGQSLSLSLCLSVSLSLSLSLSALQIENRSESDPHSYEATKAVAKLYDQLC